MYPFFITNRLPICRFFICLSYDSLPSIDNLAATKLFDEIFAVINVSIANLELPLEFSPNN